MLRTLLMFIAAIFILPDETADHSDRRTLN